MYTRIALSTFAAICWQFYCNLLARGGLQLIVKITIFPQPSTLADDAVYAFPCKAEERKKIICAFRNSLRVFLVEVNANFMTFRIIAFSKNEEKVPSVAYSIIPMP